MAVRECKVATVQHQALFRNAIQNRQNSPGGCEAGDYFVLVRRLPFQAAKNPLGEDLPDHWPVAVIVNDSGYLIKARQRFGVYRLKWRTIKRMVDIAGNRPCFEDPECAMCQRGHTAERMQVKVCRVEFGERIDFYRGIGDTFVMQRQSCNAIVDTIAITMKRDS